ncbi:MAG: immune inhibitor A, partial [Chloroflexota bacterium]|nr:immune inhibitor A [Chloroflexota bacterium]
VMVFMSLDGLRPGTAIYDSVLTHEAQHFVHWVVKPQQDSWINEGASELAMALAGYEQSGAARSYLNNPETQLNAWAEHPGQSAAHYGGGYLILEYFAQRLGGYDHLKGLIVSPGTSVQTFDSYLSARPGAPSFDDLFRDFAIANVLNDPAVADGRFAHQRLPALRARTQETQAAFPATSTATLRPYATRYVELQPGTQRGDLELRFSGAGQAPLFGASARSGRAQWWGNAADEMESTLTREVDLSAVSQATLRFGAWFNTEQHYDYAGVAVSSDNGCTWQTLSGQHTTDTNPVGQNLGHGFTGRSGGGDAAAWVDETMDLTPYAGGKVLLRFFYITDQSYHGSGFALDDVTISEIGLADDAETDQGWDAQGFLRSVNGATLDWAVQVVSFTESGPQIRQMPRSGGGDAGAVQGALSVGSFGVDVRRVIVAITPLVPVTLEAVDFRLEATLR